jgi:ankyrin repeat protein
LLAERDGISIFRFKLQSALHVACQEGILDIIKFLLDSNTDINKHTGKLYTTPLHSAIQKKQFAACKLILGYEQAVSDQNLERGMEISKQMQLTEIQALLESELDRRRELINSAQDSKPGQKI